MAEDGIVWDCSLQQKFSFSLTTALWRAIAGIDTKQPVKCFRVV